MSHGYSREKNTQKFHSGMIHPSINNTISWSDFRLCSLFESFHFSLKKAKFFALLLKYEIRDKLLIKKEIK